MRVLVSLSEPVGLGVMVMLTVDIGPTRIDKYIEWKKAGCNKQDVKE